MLDADTRAFVLEALKTIATMVVPIVALLRVRTDLDRFAAAQRAKEMNTTVESQLRRRWYHRLKGRYRDKIR